jgi:hypothetical protein
LKLSCCRTKASTWSSPTASSTSRSASISDIVADDDLTPERRAELGGYVGCPAGAMSRDEYLKMMEAAGLR